MDTFTYLLQHANQISVLTGALALIVCFAKGWIVPGWVYNKAVKDCTYWQDLAQRLIGNMERTVDVMEVLKKKVE